MLEHCLALGLSQAWFANTGYDSQSSRLQPLRKPLMVSFNHIEECPTEPFLVHVAQEEPEAVDQPATEWNVAEQSTHCRSTMSHCYSVACHPVQMRRWETCLFLFCTRVLSSRSKPRRPFMMVSRVIRRDSHSSCSSTYMMYPPLQMTHCAPVCVQGKVNISVMMETSCLPSFQDSLATCYKQGVRCSDYDCACTPTEIDVHTCCVSGKLPAHSEAALGVVNSILQAICAPLLQ